MAEGSDVEIFASSLTGITVKDNGTDVTAQFAEYEPLRRRDHGTNGRLRGSYSAN